MQGQAAPWRHLADGWSPGNLEVQERPPAQLSPAPAAHFQRPPGSYATWGIFQKWGWDQGPGYGSADRRGGGGEEGRGVQELGSEDQSALWVLHG